MSTCLGCGIAIEVGTIFAPPHLEKCAHARVQKILVDAQVVLHGTVNQYDLVQRLIEAIK